MSDPEAESTALPAGLFSGRVAFRARLRQLIACAAHERWRRMVLCDADFADWPLGERALVDDLNRWALQGGRLVMLAHDYQVVARAAPLFVRWRQQWSHRVECLALTDVAVSDMPSFLGSARWCLRRLDVVRSAGFSGGDARTLADLTEQIASLRARGEPAFPADVLGL